MAGTSIALRSACVGLPKKAQSLNTVNVLLDAKADANSVATIETLLEQCVASITPCEGVQGMPPAASLRKDVKPRRSAATALWEASRYGRSQIVARLLEGRSNVNILAPDSSTALYAAAQARRDIYPPMVFQFLWPKCERSALFLLIMHPFTGRPRGFHTSAASRAC